MLCIKVGAPIIYQVYLGIQYYDYTLGIIERTTSYSYFRKFKNIENYVLVVVFVISQTHEKILVQYLL